MTRPYVPKISRRCPGWTFLVNPSMTITRDPEVLPAAEGALGDMRTSPFRRGLGVNGLGDLERPRSDMAEWMGG